MEKIYKTMQGTGVIKIVSGAFLLKRKSDITF